MIPFYLFPFFFRSLFNRFMDQFMTDKEGSLFFSPEHKTTLTLLTEEEHQQYVTRFKKRLTVEIIWAYIIIAMQCYLVFFSQMLSGYYLWAVAIVLFLGYDSYTEVFSAFYAPKKRKWYKRLYGLIIPIILVYTAFANYFGWIIDREKAQEFFNRILDYFNLTIPVNHLLELYPKAIIGLFIIIFLFIKMRYGVHSHLLRPASKKTRHKAKEDTEPLLEEKDWEAYKRNLDAKLNPTKKKKKKKKNWAKKKDSKKQEKVTLKKYKGETTNE